MASATEAFFVTSQLMAVHSSRHPFVAARGNGHVIRTFHVRVRVSAAQSIGGDNDHPEKSCGHRAACRRHFAGNRAKRPTDRRPNAAPGGGGTARAGRYPSRRSSRLRSKFQSPGGGSDDEGLIANPHCESADDQAPQKDVHVGKGQPPQTSKEYFPHADNAQAISFKRVRSLGPLPRGPRFFISTVTFDFQI